jgi:8-amino-7-oxononanoate synthase
VLRFRAVLQAELDALAGANRLRACLELGGASRARPTISAGGPLLSFCSNDYLGLAGHPALAAASAAAAARDGFGAGASRLVSGDLTAHRALEAALAAFVECSSALVFPSGYQTNVGVISALAGPDDLIASDAANHASIIDGCRLARATVAVYRHADAADADRALGRPGAFRRRLLVTESLFSMDGDVAPLAALAATAERHDAILVIDEAHALGALGPAGRGLAAAAGVRPDVLIGTLGKAFGASGGFAAGPAELRAYLVNRARTFIYTTGLPPAVAAAATAAVELVAGAEGELRRDRLAANRDRLAAGLRAVGLLTERPAGQISPGPIFPIVLGTEARALEAAGALRARRIFVAAIRPPTVPPGTARLRVTVSSEHRDEEIDRLAAALAEIAQ